MAQMIAVENLPAEPVAVIRVGNARLSEADIARETPFHPAASLAEAQLQAARALVVRELLGQRAASLGLLPAGELAEEGADQAVAALLERELQVPEPDEDACRRYFEAHRERFAEPARIKVRHILLPAAPDDASARDAHSSSSKNRATWLIRPSFSGLKSARFGGTGSFITAR